MIRSVGMLLMAWAIPILSHGQEVKNVNPVIKIIAGEPFYVHEVLEGQTLESIAHTYASTVEAIRAENPSLTDPLITRIRIRIPYTDESAARMMEVAEEMGLKESEARQEARKRRRDERAMQEAAALLEQPESEPISNDEQNLLKQLSLTVSEGLQDLQKVEKKIVETPYLDEDGLPKRTSIKPLPDDTSVPDKRASIGGLLLELEQGFVEGDSLSYLTDLHLREYFLVRVNPDGVITNVRDERTLTNHNTMVLDVEALKGRHIADSSDAFNLQIVPIGLNLHLKRWYYPVKYKKGKIKPLKPSTKESVLEVDGPHFPLIAGSEMWPDEKGKFVVEVVEGNRYISIHDQFEYNPFGVTLDKLHEAAIKQVVSIQRR